MKTNAVFSIFIPYTQQMLMSRLAEKMACDLGLCWVQSHGCIYAQIKVMLIKGDDQIIWFMFYLLDDGIYRVGHTSTVVLR